MLPDKRTAGAIPDKVRHELKTSFPNVASNGRAEWERESVAAETVKVEAANTVARRDRRSPCSLSDLTLEHGQRQQTRQNYNLVRSPKANVSTAYFRV